MSDDQRREADAVRALVNQCLPAGYKEVFGFGMIAWVIPLADYPETYNKQPLTIAALGARSVGLTLHLMGVYGSPALRNKLEAGFAAGGKKPSLGKGCLRFKSQADLDVNVLCDVLGAVAPADYIRIYEEARSGRATC